MMNINITKGINIWIQPQNTEVYVLITQEQFRNYGLKSLLIVKIFSTIINKIL